MSGSGEFIALYGTLMSGLGGQERLGIRHRLESVGPCILRGSLVELGWYPGMLDDRAGRVVGELFRVLDDKVLAVLDRYEGFDPADPAGSEYLRTMVTALEPAVEVWVYLFTGPVPSDARIRSGDWRAHVGGGAS